MHYLILIKSTLLEFSALRFPKNRKLTMVIKDNLMLTLSVVHQRYTPLNKFGDRF
jgi:hypothetical protein